MPVRWMYRTFFDWYERHYTLNIGIAACLFVLQLIHLYWLTVHVVFIRLFGVSMWDPTGVTKAGILIVDYTEIPALISVTVLYLNELRKQWSWKSVIFILFLNSQWLHLFWITDAYVLGEFTGSGAGNANALPAWLAWLAIMIDYLELPVIFDTMKKFIVATRQQRIGQFLREDFARD
jgi:hypothetical protein